MLKKVSVPRNYFLVPGITRYSRTAIKKIKKEEKTGKRKKTLQEVEVPKKKPALRKKGIKKSKYYPAEKVPRPKLSRASKVQKTPKLRSSITPGTILILLAGRHAGKRVVFLKQLASGLLLVNGPLCVNGVPLRRVDAAYVIATSTRIDLNFDIDSKFDDAYFRRMKVKKEKSKEETFFSKGKGKKRNNYVLSDERRKDQKAVDSMLLPLIKKTEQLKPYLRHKFSLKGNTFPHLLKF